VAREDAPIVVGGVRVRIEVDDPDAAGSADLGDGGRRRPGDRVVAAENDRDRPRSGYLVDLAVDESVAAFDPGRDDVRVPGVDDGEQLEGPDVYCASRMARGPKRAPGRWLTASSKGAPMIATSTPLAMSCSGSVIQGRFMNVVGPT
jgi:hypothetical protein